MEVHLFYQKKNLRNKPTSTFVETNICSSMLSNRERSKVNNVKEDTTSVQLKRKIASKTVIKHNKSTDIDYSAKSSKLKPQK